MTTASSLCDNCGHTLIAHTVGTGGSCMAVNERSTKRNSEYCDCKMFVDPVEMIDHPAHYGGAQNPYEAIKVIEAWQLGFCLGNTVKYIARAEHKGALLEDLRKAAWYLNREIEQRTEAI